MAHLSAWVVDLPTGLGKTRRVLRHILRGCSARPVSWRSKIKEIAVLGPNQHIDRIWHRELLLLARARRVRSDALRALNQDDIRQMNGRDLRELCEEVFGTRLIVKTYRRVGGARGARILVLDEWHRLPRRIVGRCRALSEEELAASLRREAFRSQAHRPFGRPPWFLASGRGVKRIYFVSATPVNPVLENEVDLEGENPEELQRRESMRIRDALWKASFVMAGFIRGSNRRAAAGWRRPHSDGALTFDQVLSCLRVARLDVRADGVRYRAPEPGMSAGLSEPNRLEAGFLKEWLSADHANGYSEAYALAVGLVATKGRDHHLSARSSRSFAFPYKNMYRPRTRMAAWRWLSGKHPRLARLLEILEVNGVVKRDSAGRLRFTRKKALVFCQHQGVCAGVAEALNKIVSSPLGERKRHYRPCETSLKRVKKRGGTHRRMSDIIHHFNRPSAPYVVVATDRLSESVDMHEQCSLIIHYELPWSPIRLIQRVGRLSRIRGGAFNRPDVYHVIVPGWVEEERVNRLTRRFSHLEQWGLLRMLGALSSTERRTAVLSFIGRGPSLHWNEQFQGAPAVRPA